MIEDKGDIPIDGCDDANIPVNGFVRPPDNDSKKWVFYADNFMPRKGHISQRQYELEADTKEELLEAIRKHVVPLYETALRNWKDNGCCYYWS